MPVESISIIIPWCNRDELERSLRENSPRLKNNNIEIIVVNCGGNGNTLRPRLSKLALPSARWLELKVGHFNKSFALNVGVSYASYEALFFLDADVILRDRAIEDGMSLLSEGSFVTIERVHESKAVPENFNSAIKSVNHCIELVDQEGSKHQLATNTLNLETRTRAAPGLVFVRKEDFIRVGGMNSALQGWGWEDLDLLARLQISIGLTRYQAGAVLHLSHDDDVRDLTGIAASANEALNFSKCLASYCLGDFLGTYVDDAQIGSALCETYFLSPVD